MYGVTFYIKPEDILDKLSEEDKARFNQCVFYDINKNLDGSINIDCLLFNDRDKDSLYCRNANRIKLF